MKQCWDSKNELHAVPKCKRGVSNLSVYEMSHFKASKHMTGSPLKLLT